MRQAIAGRIQVTSGFVNLLVRDDILRQRNLGIELTPLKSELWLRREEIQPKLTQSDPPLEHEFTSLKSAIDVLRRLVGRMDDDVEPQGDKGSTNWKRTEIAMAQAEIKRLQQCLSDQTKANESLERYLRFFPTCSRSREVELFRTIYNARIEYYRQLQSLSVFFPV